MTHVITSLCVRDGGCVAVCPVECIVPGKPQEQYPIFYIDPNTCIDCGACIPECPVGAIFTLHDVPFAYQARGGAVLCGIQGETGFEDHFDGFTYEGEPVHLPAVRILESGEIVNLTEDIARNRAFFDEGPGYLSIDI